MIKEKLIRKLRVVPGKGIRLKNFETGWAQNEELKIIRKRCGKGTGSRDTRDQPANSCLVAGTPLG